MFKHFVSLFINTLFHNLWYLSAHELVFVVWDHALQKKILFNKLFGVPANT